jgi:predicted permease
MLARLPLIQAIVIGLALNFLDIMLPDYIQTFVRFNGKAAAPLALLALGIVLSQITIRPDKVVWVFTALKIAVFPLMVWTTIWLIAPISPENSKFLFSAAGPITTAVFSLGMLYEVPTTRIAQMLVLTTVLSLISLAVLA